MGLCAAGLLSCGILLGTCFGVGRASGQAVPRAGKLKIAFTFDDLPSHGELPPGMTRVGIATSLAHSLSAGGLPPVYGFINGKGVAGDAEQEPALKAWRDGGQLLGNHTFTHPDLNDVTARAFNADLAGNTALLEKYMDGEDFHWFRYPFLHEGETGAKRNAVRRYLAANGYHVAQVTIDFGDYLWNDPYARCVQKKDNAAVKELHDTYLSEANRYITIFRTMAHDLYGRDIRYILLLHEGAFDAKMMPELIGLFRRRGFSFVTLPEAEADPVYRQNPNIADKDGGTFMEQVNEQRNITNPQLDKPEARLDSLCR